MSAAGPFDDALARTRAYLARVERLNARLRAGEVRARVPESLMDASRPLEDLIEECLPASHAALESAKQALFYSLPVAFDPAESVGCYLATADRAPDGEPYRFIDMGALIATHAFGENDPDMVAAVLRELHCAVTRYAHSEYQTTLSLRMKAALAKIAPHGAPRYFVVNTGAEAVENAIKAVLLHRVRTAGEKDGGFIISFEGAFHGRTLGALAVTHRKKARMGFPTFEWPQAPFPANDASEAITLRREQKSLRYIWDLLVSGRLPHPEKRGKEDFKRALARIDEFLLRPGDVGAFVAAERAMLTADVQKRSRRVAAVLVEPIQGEGGVRAATPRFFRRLRLLTRIYDVPLVFDEVQTGWGATGRLWAHEALDLPLPPDIVTWAKKAQNGVLFVSEELATFFQEEKKFNTTWEGDSAGMVRLLAMLEKLDLEQVRRTGALARAALEALSKEFPELVLGVRGAGVMLGFDVARPDWRDVLRDRAFRRGLILLPAGERTLRFYPRYDTPPQVIEEAVAILRAAVEDIVRGGSRPAVGGGPLVRVGAIESPLEVIEAIDLDPARFDELQEEIVAVEVERYGSISQYPPDVLRAGPRPLLQYPPEALEATIGNARSLGIALRDTVAGRIVAYALGSPLENHDELGCREDPHWGENNVFYLLAAAVSTAVLNRAEVEKHLLELMRKRAAAAGYEYLSALVEERLVREGPDWLRSVEPLRVAENYLRSGLRFVYVQVPLEPKPAAPAAVAGAAAPGKNPQGERP